MHFLCHNINKIIQYLKHLVFHPFLLLGTIKTKRKIKQIFHNVQNICNKMHETGNQSVK